VYLKKAEKAKDDKNSSLTGIKANNICDMSLPFAPVNKLVPATSLLWVL